jgi:hypothetical protein
MPLTIVVVIIGRTPMIVATQSLNWTGQQKRQFESHKSLRGRDGCNAQIGDQVDRLGDRAWINWARAVVQQDPASKRSNQ